MPEPPTTSWWPFPPITREVQFDGKWSFVYKKQKNCDPTNPDDDHCGDYWDHVAFDPEHKLVLGVIPGARTGENTDAIVAKVCQQLGGKPPELMTSDEYAPYTTAIEKTFSEPVAAPRGRKPRRPRILPKRQVRDDVIYATVHKHRENNRVIAVEQRQIFGSPEGLEEVRSESLDQRWQERSPAMAARLTDHVWTWREWIRRPAAQST